MKTFTFLATAALAFVTLTANATDKYFYKIAQDKDPGWTIQDASNFEGTPGKDYYQAYNKKNGGRMLNFEYPTSAWDGIDLAALPNQTYKWTLNLKMTTMATRSDMELVLLPVGATTLTDSRVSTHNYHWWNSTETEDYFFRFRVMTAPTEANGDFTLIINENPSARNDWPTTENADSLFVMSSNVEYNFAVEVNTEANTATYAITNVETGEVVKTGVHNYVCEEDRIGYQIFSMNGTSVHQLSNMGLSYYVEGVIANTPSVDLFWVEGTERDYFAQFQEGEVLHWKQLGDAVDFISGAEYYDGETYAISYTDAKDSREFEEDIDAEGGQKIITCNASGILEVWTSREDDDANTSDVVNTEVVAEIINLPAPVATITNVKAGFGKEYTLSVDNSEVALTPTVTIIYTLTQSGQTSTGTCLSGETVSFTGEGTLELQSADLTHPIECYGRSETVTISNNVEYQQEVFCNYAIDKAAAEGTIEGFTATTLNNFGNKSHWERIYSDQSYGVDADGNIVVNDGTQELTDIKTGFGFFPGSAIGTEEDIVPVQKVNTDAFETAVQPLVITQNDKTDDYWYLFPYEGLVSFQTSLTNVPMNVDSRYVSDDATKPNFYIVHTRGGYDRPDKGDCNATTVVVAGEEYSLYRYDTAICDVTVMTYKGFVAGIEAIENDTPAQQAPAAYNLRGERVESISAPGIYVQAGRVILVK